MNRKGSEGKDACLVTSSNNSITTDNDICQHTRPVTTDQLQTGITSLISRTRQLLGSMHHSTTDFVPLPVRTNELDSNLSVGSRRPQEGRMPSTDGTVGRGTTTPRSTGGGTEGNAQGSTLLERRRGGKPTLGIRKDDHDKPHIPISENHTRVHLIKIIREDLMQQSSPKGSDYLGFGRHGARTYQEVLQLDHETLPLGRSSGRISNLTVDSRGSLRGWRCRASSRNQILENNMTQERMPRRNRQLEEEKLFAEMQASKELDKRRKTPEQKGASSTTDLEEENVSLKEQVWKSTEEVQLLMTSSQERGAASSAESSGQ